MIKNIILDFGDIFINLDKPAVFTELSKFGYSGMTTELDTLAKTYEKGLISSSTFILELNNHFPTASPVELKKAWNSILNEVHPLKTLAERFNRFKFCFERFYLSHEINFRKPDCNIYEYVLLENKLIPEETFFIDDTKENTDAATLLGIKSWNLQVGKEDIIDLKTRL